MSTSVASTAGAMSDKLNQARAVPVRVKKKTLKKLTNAERLEAENAKMEERLRMLRQTIEKEKQQRSAKPQTGYLWKSGQPGAMTTHARDHLSKNKSAGIKLGGEKKIKVKFLTPAAEKDQSKEKRAPRVSTPHNTATTAGDSWAQPQTLPHGAVNHNGGHNNGQSSGQDDAENARLAAEQAHAQGMRSSNAWGEEMMQRQRSVVGPICGQCEINGAQMNCMECGEKYCSECFGVFHRKGALKSHTSRPLTRQTDFFVPPKQPNIDAPISENSLWGTYDENAAAQSFAEAVKAWRGDDSPSGYQGECEAGKTTDSSQTVTRVEPEINFSDNTELSYFDRMLLKKQKESANNSVADSESTGEITVSQLDFCRDLLAHNLEEDRKSRMEMERPESVIEIVEVNSDIGYLEEESVFHVEENDEETDEDDIENQMALARSLLSSVKIEEYSPYTENMSTAGAFSPEDVHLSKDAEPVLNSNQLEASRDQATEQLVSSPRENGVARSPQQSVARSPRLSVTKSRDSIFGSSRDESFSKSRDSAAVGTPPRTPVPPPKRAVTPPRSERSAPKSDEIRSSVQRLGRNFNESPRSPLLKRMPTNPDIRRSYTAGAPDLSTSSPAETQRPRTADVVILSSQAWKQSFIGFVKAGLPGYTLPATPPPPASAAVDEEEIMIRGPPSWCPGESRVDNEIFQSRENTISFSLQESDKEKTGTSQNSSLSFEPTRISPPVVQKSGSFTKKDKDLPACTDLDTSTELDYDSETILADLGKELSVTRSYDLGDHITNLRKATPDPVTLLTHEDRMSQLDLESRGMTPEVTALITPRITTRESLFLDFEDMEQQVMAGENVNDLI